MAYMVSGVVAFKFLNRLDDGVVEGAQFGERACVNVTLSVDIIPMHFTVFQPSGFEVVVVGGQIKLAAQAVEGSAEDLPHLADHRVDDGGVDDFKFCTHSVCWFSLVLLFSFHVAKVWHFPDMGKFSVLRILKARDF